GFEEWSVGPAVAAPSVVIDKTATVYNEDGSLDDNNTVDSATDYIQYTVTIANNGTIDLHNIVVSDSFEGGTAVTLDNSTVTGDGPTTNVLDIGETWTYTYTHHVTAQEYADALAGNSNGNFTLDNVASVVTTETPDPVSDPASVPVEEGATPAGDLHIT